MGRLARRDAGAHSHTVSALSWKDPERRLHDIADARIGIDDLRLDRHRDKSAKQNSSSPSWLARHS